VISERRVLNFKASQLLKMSLNDGKDAAAGLASPEQGAASLAGGPAKIEVGADAESPSKE
jgi:hypothetical protein